MAFESLRGKSKRSLARMTGFYLSVVAFVFFWLLAFNFQLYAVFAAWFDPVLADTSHFVHDIALATWVWVWGVAMAVQLYRPAKRVTAMQVALVLTVADVGVGVALGAFEPSALLFFGPIFVAAALHPAGVELVDVRRVGRDSLDPVSLGLVALAAVPVLLYVLGQFQLQGVLRDEHAAFGHYSTMAYYGLSLLGMGALAAVRTRGRRLPAYGAGLLAAMLGVASVFQPTMSGLDSTWAALAVLWALAFVGSYEWTVRRGAANVTVPPAEAEQPKVSP